jgi:hypothetical protein
MPAGQIIMTRQPNRHMGDSGALDSTAGKYVSSASDVGTGNFAHSPIAVDHSGSSTDHSVNNTEHSVANPDQSLGDQSASAALLAIDGAIDGSTIPQGNLHSIDQPHIFLTSGSEFVATPGTNHGLLVENYTADDNLNDDHLSSIFDYVDNLTDGFSNPVLGDANSSPSNQSFVSPEMPSFGLPDVFSDARGHGGGGGGGGGGGHGSTPASYTTNS